MTSSGSQALRPARPLRGVACRAREPPPSPRPAGTQIGALHRQPFLGPSGAAGAAPPTEAASVRSADAFSDPVVGAIHGTRSAAKPPPRCGATGRLFDAAGRRRGFFDPSLRQGY
jgi:hypothetical protein